MTSPWTIYVERPNVVETHFLRNKAIFSAAHFWRGATRRRRAPHREACGGFSHRLPERR